MRMTPHLCMVVSFLRQLTPERLKGNRGLPSTHLLARHAFETRESFGTRRTMLTDVDGSELQAQGTAAGPNSILANFRRYFACCEDLRMRNLKFPR